MAELERLSRAGQLTLRYGDESHVCSEGHVPYGWQFPGEGVFMAAQKGFRLNCWGLFGRDNQCRRATSTTSITAAFVVEELERLSLQLPRADRRGARQRQHPYGRHRAATAGRMGST
ncbi:hypothetical protein [Hymenobacter elongatus]|uniref:hypothetical protein n=1 Tax=Hymenobacter elongatus TaxID=877208 RepID=UPI001AEBE3B5|nr:hypothetical protein [Hymenobacter elongatus]